MSNLVQDDYPNFWTEDVVHKQVDERLTKTFHTVRDTITKKKVDQRLGAMVFDVARVAEVCKLKDWV